MYSPWAFHGLTNFQLEKARLLAHQASTSHRLVDHERGPSPTTSSFIHSFHNAPPSSPTRATQSSHVPTHFRHPASHKTESSLEDADPTIRAVSPEQLPHTHQPHPIEDLDHQIKYLASTVDAFTAERDVLSQVIAAERPVRRLYSCSLLEELISNGRSHLNLVFQEPLSSVCCWLKRNVFGTLQPRPTPSDPTTLAASH